MITITTLKDRAGTDRAFAKIGSDMGKSLWYCSALESASGLYRLAFRSSRIGSKKTKEGSPYVRGNVNFTFTAPYNYVAANGSETPATQEIVVNVTVTAPEMSTVLSDDHIRDAVAFATNAILADRALQLRRGEV